MLRRADASRAMAVGALAVVCMATSSACRSSSSDGPAALRVEVDGATRAWKLVDIEALPTQDVTLDGSVYKGVSLTRLLPAPLAPEESVVARGADGSTQTLPYAAASRPECLVAHGKDGRSLSAAEGPLRIVLVDSPGLSVRNLVNLRVEKARN